MKYSKLLWELFGVAHRDWDNLAYNDFLWMRDAANQHIKQQQEAANQK